jgi:hypothetical protein
MSHYWSGDNPLGWSQQYSLKMTSSHNIRDNSNKSEISGGRINVFHFTHKGSGIPVLPFLYRTVRTSFVSQYILCKVRKEVFKLQPLLNYTL